MNPHTIVNWLTEAESDERDQLEAETMGWIPLEEGCYLHLGDPLALVRGEEIVIDVVGVADASLAGMNVLLLIQHRKNFPRPELGLQQSLTQTSRPKPRNARLTPALAEC